MKSPIKHILLRKHKTYTEKDKVFILDFTKSTKELLKNSNLYVKGLAISIAKFLIKKHFGLDTEVYVNLYDQQCWCDKVIEEINIKNFSLSPSMCAEIRFPIVLTLITFINLFPFPVFL